MPWESPVLIMLGIVKFFQSWENRQRSNHFDNPSEVLMLLATSTKFTVDQEDIVIPAIMSGFRDCCLAAGTEIRGGQTAKNPWVLLGGCATSVLPMSEIVMPNQAKEGDVLILTKPLGIRVAVNLNQWLDTKPERIEQESSKLRS